MNKAWAEFKVLCRGARERGFDFEAELDANAQRTGGTGEVDAEFRRRLKKAGKSLQPIPTNHDKEMRMSNPEDTIGQIRMSVDEFFRELLRHDQNSETPSSVHVYVGAGNVLKYTYTNGGGLRFEAYDFDDFVRMALRHTRNG